MPEPPVEPSSPPRRGREQGLSSEVKATAEVCPTTAYLRLDLKITALNQRSKPLPLERPYYLPEAQGIYNAKAWDERGDLLVSTIRGREAVIFRTGDVIDPGGKYSWNVHLECPGPFRKVGDSIAGVYTVKPRPQLSGVRVTKHDFHYTMKFPKPPPKRLWAFKRVALIIVPNRSIKISTEGSRQESIAILQFRLNRQQEARMLIASRYQRSSVPAIISALMTGLITGIIGSLIATYLYQKFTP